MKAGITTSLLVGPAGAETFTVDGVAGVVTAGDINGAAIAASGDITAGGNVLPSTPGSGFVGRTTDRFLAVAANAGNFLQADLGEVVITGVATVGSLKLDPASVEATDILDEDDMVSDSATAIPTQQSVKKYVDDAVQGAVGGGGAFSGTNADLTGYIAVGTTASFGETVTFDSADTGLEGFRIGTSGQEILSIDTDVTITNSNSALPTRSCC